MLDTGYRTPGYRVRILCRTVMQYEQYRDEDIGHRTKHEVFMIQMRNVMQETGYRMQYVHIQDAGNRIQYTLYTIQGACTLYRVEKFSPAKRGIDSRNRVWN